MASLPGAVWLCEQLHTASGAHFNWRISASTRSMGRTASYHQQLKQSENPWCFKPGVSAVLVWPHQALCLNNRCLLRCHPPHCLH